MRKVPTILIGTLYSGENELDECIESVKMQRYPHWEHKIFRNMPNVLAHATLYQEFFDRGCEFDLFLKLDADMVLIGEDALSKVVKLFEQYEGLDNAELVVDDWLTNSLIWGAHIFSNRAVWPPRDDLFPDKDPVIPGIKKTFSGYPAPIARHCPNPSPFQAYHFGLHRAVKAMDGSHIAQMKILEQVWNHFSEIRDRRLGFVILGAEHVISKKLKKNNINYTESNTRVFFNTYKDMTSDELYTLLYKKWGNSHIRNVRYKTNGLIKRVASFIQSVNN